MCRKQGDRKETHNHGGLSSLVSLWRREAAGPEVGYDSIGPRLGQPSPVPSRWAKEGIHEFLLAKLTSLVWAI